MKNILKDETTLHGKLIGVGKIKKDGTEEFKWLEKPIHNTIVNQGIDYLFTNNGSNNADIYMSSSMWSSDYSEYIPFGVMFANTNHSLYTNLNHFGCLAFMRYGSGNTPTQPTDTDLENPYADTYTSTYKTGSPMCGTYKVSYGKYKLRITHITEVSETDYSVNEIGWYGKNGSTNEYVMFSRVVLDEPYELDQGEQLITSYELNLNFSNVEITHIDNFFDLYDYSEDENNPKILQCDVKRAIYDNGSTFNFPGISTAGVSTFKHDYNVPFIPNLYSRSFNFSGNKKYNIRIYYKNSDKTFPAENAIDSGLSYDDSSSAATLLFKDYVAGSFQRDITIIMPQYFPNNTPLEGYTDIHYINFCGMAYRFGYYTEDEDPDTHEIVKTWHPQALRKYGNKILKITFRNTLTPSNTPGEVDVDEQTP